MLILENHFSTYEHQVWLLSGLIHITRNNPGSLVMTSVQDGLTKMTDKPSLNE